MTDKQTLLELADKVEAAGASEQRELLIEAWWALSGMSHNRDAGLAAIDLRFKRMLDAEAYESAAMMLIPDECVWSLYNSDDPSPLLWKAAVMPFRVAAGESVNRTKVRALALVAASLRARAQ